MRYLHVALAATALSAVAATGHAGSLQVAPVNVEVVAPAVASTVKLRNEGKDKLNAQVRVFRWSQANGRDVLEPTNDLVASPPMVTLAPGSDYTVRLVRTARRPVQAEESYRLIVDELPNPSRKVPGNVELLLRHSVPVFVRPQGNPRPQLNFALKRKDKGQVLRVENTGERRARLARVTLQQSDGRPIVLSQGLSGYALAGSALEMPMPSRVGNLQAEGALTVRAESDVGPINAPLSR